VVCERLHQSMGNALHVFLSQELPFNVHLWLNSLTVLPLLHSFMPLIQRFIGL
jgi:hypothetical protein